MASSTRTLAAALVAGALVAGSLRAESAYHPDYDYRGQGDDWYGRSGDPDPDRDYPPALFLDEYSAGDDYDLGHDPRAAVLGLDVPLSLTNKLNYEYFLRFNATLGCPSDQLECSDGVFCNGDEFCSLSGCTAGAPPCIDGNPCTTDLCSEGGGSCSYLPAPPPGATSGLVLDRAPSSTVATLHWSDVAGAESYNVYRGEIFGLPDLACFLDGVAGTTVDDDGAAPEARVLFYLTNAVACGQESSLGTGSAGVPRVPLVTCP